MSRLRLRLSTFIRDEGGSAAIESLLWIPMFFVILCLTVEVCLITSSQSMVMRVVQDGNRAYAMRRLDPAGVQTFVANTIANISPRATVTSAEFTVPNSASATGVLTTVRMPASDLSPFGVIPGFLEMNITVASQQIREF